MSLITRRGLIHGVVGLIAAPSIVRASSLMAIRGLPVATGRYYWEAVLNPGDVEFNFGPYFEHAVPDGFEAWL